MVQAGALLFKSFQVIESLDSTGARWSTVGVSDNIIDASFQALMDSIIYKLMKNREMAGLVAAE